MAVQTKACSRCGSVACWIQSPRVCRHTNKRRVKAKESDNDNQR